MSTQIRCVKHPRYTGKRQPRCDCEACWLLWGVLEMQRRKAWDAARRRTTGRQLKPKRGWLRRVLDDAKRDYEQWPAWMKRLSR